MSLARLVLLALAVAAVAAWIAWGTGGGRSDQPGGRGNRSNRTDPPVPIGDPILVDPGHGGVDGGAKVDGVVEKELNLQIALRLAEALRQLGVPVEMTRETDTELSPPRDGRTIYPGRHKADLRARRAAARKTGVWAMVSIHANAAPDRKTAGTVVFHQDRPLSRALAESICAELKAALPERRCEVDAQRLFLLANPALSVVLVETAYLSHPGDRALAREEAFQQAVAGAIARGVARVWLDHQPLTPPLGTHDQE